MSLQAVLAPLFVQVGLTFLLLFLTGRARFAAIRAGEVRVGDIALGQRAWPEGPAKAANSFDNQFQLPVLFYVLTILAIIARKADLLFVALAWVFVALRIVHAFIHVGGNVVIRRFQAYVAGMAVLLIMWILFAIRVLLAW
ncbi:MAG TPA: MAPEG family protein [Beijerinckiaceae bacterium]|jgi:hypothetical protein